MDAAKEKHLVLADRNRLRGGWITWEPKIITQVLWGGASLMRHKAPTFSLDSWQGAGFLVTCPTE